ERQTVARGDTRRRALAATADPDDVFCFHLRASPPLVCQRFRRSRSSRAWIDRHRRNDRRVGYRDLPHPGHVLCNRALLRRPRTESRGTVTAESSPMIENLPKPIALYI